MRPPPQRPEERVLGSFTGSLLAPRRDGALTIGEAPVSTVSSRSHDPHQLLVADFAIFSGGFFLGPLCLDHEPAFIAMACNLCTMAAKSSEPPRHREGPKGDRVERIGLRSSLRSPPCARPPHARVMRR